MMIKLQAKDMDFGYNSSKILQNVNFEIALQSWSPSLGRTAPASQH